jgi:hypothetical protein
LGFVLSTPQRSGSTRIHIFAKAEDRGGSLGDDSVTVTVSDSSTCFPPIDWEILDYEVTSQSGQRVEEWHVDYGPSFLTIFGTVTWRFEDKVFGNQLLDGSLDVEVRIRLHKKTPTQTGEVETLFLTGRRPGPDAVEFAYDGTGQLVHATDQTKRR